MSALASGPATRASAAAMSPTLMVSAGRLTALRPPQAWSLAVAAQRSPAMALAGEASATSVSGLARGAGRHRAIC
jgi:hypothetical protein